MTIIRKLKVYVNYWVLNGYYNSKYTNKTKLFELQYVLC